MEGLIRRVWADPLDDGAWLVLADWLRERSDPRADGVARTLRDPRPISAPDALDPDADDAQVLFTLLPLAALPCAGSFRALVRAIDPVAAGRRAEILQLLQRWLTPWPDEARQPAWSVHATLAEGEALPWWWPLARALGPVWTREAALARWVEDPEAFGSLTLLGARLADGADRLASVDALEGLRGLALDLAFLVDEDLPSLLASGRLRRLEQLVISDGLVQSPSAPSAILEALPTLRRLVLDCPEDSWSTRDIQRDHPVQWLHLAGDTVEWTDTISGLPQLQHLGAGAKRSLGNVVTVLHGPGFPQLTSLDLGRCSLPQISGASLADARVVGRLRYLGLPPSSVHDTELARWRDRPPLEHLVHLAVPPDINAHSASQLLACEAFVGAPLYSLDLRGTRVDETLVGQLRAWPTLTELYLSMSRIHADALRDLASSETWNRLRYLHISVHSRHQGRALQGILNRASHRPRLVVYADDAPGMRISDSLTEPGIEVDTWHGLPQERVGGHGSSMGTRR